MRDQRRAGDSSALNASPAPSIDLALLRTIRRVTHGSAGPVVVGVDGSERAYDALTLAALLAAPEQRVLVTHVHPYGPMSNLLSSGEYESLVRDVTESAFLAVQETLASSLERELRLVSDATPAGGLQTVAADNGASLIVVGSSHRSGLGRVHPGSVTESVLSGAPVPVAVAPSGYARQGGELRRIGCGFDGSSESREALQWAVSAARARDAEVVALSVHSPVAFGGVSTAPGLGYQSANDALRAGLEAKLHAAVECVDAGARVSARTLDGDPVTLLRDASAELDLMVLGSRGFGPFRTLLLGSVSRAVVRDAACPVVAVPRHD